MREHPVPQDITGYKFHIVGSMTIKQFAMVMGGVVLAFLVNLTNLPAFLKWPIMILLTGLGAGAAFVPIEEQPLDHWIVTFFRVLYKPTQYYWRKSAKIPDAFLYEQKTKIDENDVPPDLTPAKKERIKEYLFSLNDNSTPDEFDQYEQNRSTALESSFNNTTTHSRTIPSKKTGFIPTFSNTQALAAKPATNSIATHTQATKTKQQIQSIEPELSYNNPIEQSRVQTAPAVINTKPEPTQSSLAIPQLEAPQLEERQAPLVNEEQATTKPEVVNQNSFSQTLVKNNTNNNFDKTTTNITYNADLPFPSKPSIPNKIVGMVLSKNNELVNDAIIEIRSNSGQVMRAVKSNSLGQFFISTPLKNGNYIINAEKSGFEFTPSRLILEGKVLEPIEIKSL